MPLSHTSVTVCDKVLLPVTVVIARTGRLIRRKCQLMLAFAWCKGQHQLTREGNPFADEGRMKSDLRLVWCLCRDIFCHFGKRAPALHFVHHRHSDLSSCFGFLFRYKKVKKKVAGVIRCLICICVPVIQKTSLRDPQLSHSPLRADSELTWPSGKIYRDVAQWSTLCCGLPAQIQSWNNAAEHNTAWKQERLWVVVL